MKMILFETVQVNFSWKLLHQWSHFFKPSCFKDEEEYRVLYHYEKNEDFNVKKEWFYAKSLELCNSYVEFDGINQFNFPLTLKKVILGPKFPEKDLNCKQIKNMLCEKGLDIKVDKSKIVCYR